MTHNKNISKIVLVLALGLCVGKALFDYSNTTHSIEQPAITHRSGHQPAQQRVISDHINYAHYIKKFEIDAWNGLAHAYGVTREACEQRKKECARNDHKKNKLDKNSTISADTCTLIRSVLKDFDIDPSKISITSWDDHSCAGVNNNIIFVNEKRFNELSYRAKKFVIGHELQHMKHQDFFMSDVLQEVLKRHTVDCAAQNEPLNVYCRFKEERADIQTALKNKEYAQGYVEFVQQKLLAGDNPGITHPKHSKRLQIARDIVAQLNNKQIQSC